MLLAHFQALLRQRAGKELHSQALFLVGRLHTTTLFVENLGADPSHDTEVREGGPPSTLFPN